jgi:polysaccharide biosynthesis protein PslH
MKNVCVLFPDLIVPPDTGGRKASYYRWVELAKFFNIYPIIVNSAEVIWYEESDEYKMLITVAKKVWILERLSKSLRKGSFFQKIVGLFFWLISGKPRFAQTFASRSYRERVTSYILESETDLLCLETPYVYELIDYDRLKAAGVSIICVMHNIEHRFIVSLLPQNSLLRQIARVEVQRVRNYETSVLQRMDRVIGISDWDVEYITRKMGINNAIYLPSLLPLFKKTWDWEASSNYIVFSGGLSFSPNLDGIKWFLRNVYLAFLQKNPKIILKITGSVSEEIKADLSRFKNIEFTGYLDEDTLCSTLSKALFMVVPIFLGAGVKIKLIEALAYGLPIIVTNEATIGIPLQSSLPFEVVGNADEFLKTMNILASSADVRNLLSERAKECFENNYEVTKNIFSWVAAYMKTIEKSDHS